MSRIGKIPVDIIQGVKVTIKNNTVHVEGLKGKLFLDFNPLIKMKLNDNTVIVTRADDTKKSKSLHGLYRKLINNMIIGVSSGFEKMLLINGVGYRAEKKEDILILNLGYSNPIQYPIPKDISIEVEANTKIKVACIDKQKLGQVCAEIRSFRPPEPYKGKGIRYENEIVKKKVGKSGIT